MRNGARISGCSTIDLNSGGGGIKVYEGGNVHVTGGSVIEDCWSEAGGGAIAAVARCVVKVDNEVRFERCYSLTVGGALTAFSSGSISVSDSTFASCTAVGGGVARLAGGGLITFNGCRIVGCSASTFAGAFFLRGTSQARSERDM